MNETIMFFPLETMRNNLRKLFSHVIEKVDEDHCRVYFSCSLNYRVFFEIIVYSIHDFHFLPGDDYFEAEHLVESVYDDIRYLGWKYTGNRTAEDWEYCLKMMRRIMFPHGEWNPPRLYNRPES